MADGGHVGGAAFGAQPHQVVKTTSSTVAPFPQLRLPRGMRGRLGFRDGLRPARDEAIDAVRTTHDPPVSARRRPLRQKYPIIARFSTLTPSLRAAGETTQGRQVRRLEDVFSAPLGRFAPLAMTDRRGAKRRLASRCARRVAENGPIAITSAGYITAARSVSRKSSTLKQRRTQCLRPRGRLWGGKQSLIGRQA